MAVPFVGYTLVDTPLARSASCSISRVPGVCGLHPAKHASVVVGRASRWVSERQQRATAG